MSGTVVEKLALAELRSDDNIYLEVSDVIDIEKIPDVILEVIGKYTANKQNEWGLPASGFIGKNGIKITGIFKYGELGFISYVGDKSLFEGESLIHLFSNISEEDYEKLEEYASKMVEMEELDERHQG